MNSRIAVAVGLAAVIAAVLAPASAFTPAFAADVAADITSGASSKTTDAFSPNPLNVNVGDTVTWTNKDSTAHTVTSGTGANDPDKGKEFDSSPNFTPIISVNGKFSHTFDKAGEFAYFCALHPTMVGTVMVAGEPQPQSFSVTASLDGKDYVVAGTGDAKATSATIESGKSVTIMFDKAGSTQLTLPKSLIANVTASNGVSIVSENDTSTTVSVTVPDSKSVQIMGAFVVPEFPVIAAILVASIAAFVGYARFAGRSTGFFGKA